VTTSRVESGRRGGQATLHRYGVQSLAEWGKQGGRPPNEAQQWVRDLIARGAKVARGHTIGRKDTSLFILLPCPTCGKERWIRLLKGLPESTHCRHCAGFHSHWKGGRVQGSDGYIKIKLQPGNPFYGMRKAGGYVFEHRLVMAQHLGRPLHSWEVVHHKDGNKGNNSLDNLQLATRNSHATDHNKGYQNGYADGFADGRAGRVKALTAEVSTLKAEIARLHNYSDGTPVQRPLQIV